ncbi:hypothetical protein T484DRAFT_3644791 [Baffinella frigidus]|nr:hypothetical protein T484DRAFT_3644791 [Cryptophyta sp. CCMP2293]
MAWVVENFVEELMQGRADVHTQMGSVPFLCPADQPFPEHVFLRLAELDENLRTKDVLRRRRSTSDESLEKHHRRHHHHSNKHEKQDGVVRRTWLLGKQGDPQTQVVQEDDVRDGRFSDIDQRKEAIAGAKGEELEDTSSASYWDTVRNRRLLASKRASFIKPRLDSSSVASSASVPLEQTGRDVQPAQDRKTHRATGWRKGYELRASSDGIQGHPEASEQPRRVRSSDGLQGESGVQTRAAHGSKTERSRFRRASCGPPEGRLVGVTAYYHLMVAKFPNVLPRRFGERASSLDDSSTASKLSTAHDCINHRACSDPLPSPSARVPHAKTALLLSRPGRNMLSRP